MIKKLLLIAAFVLPLFSAEDSYIERIYNVQGTQYAIFDKSNSPDNTPGKFPGANYDNNWVGVYKTGESNDWDNVLKWSWAKDLKGCIADPHAGCIDIAELGVGDYEIRYFLDNSYITDYSKRAVVNDDNLHQKSFIDVVYGRNREDNVHFNASTIGKDTWVGVYKKGTSNAWENVLAWKWYDISDKENMRNIIKIPNPDPYTDYEVRLFYNNSYKLEAKAEFRLDKPFVPNGPKISVAKQRDFGLVFETTTSGKGNKDWVGLFNVHAPNSWDNVLAWSWVDVEPGVYGKGFSVEGLPSGEYELRLYYHNSYDIEDNKYIRLKF